MKARSFNYLAVLTTFALLMLLGCSGSGSTENVKTTEKGTTITVTGQVGEKSTSKSLSAEPVTGTVSVLNAGDASVLATTNVNADGTFSGLSFTLPSTKAILVFKAVTNKSTTPFYSIVPIDLSNPPAPGIGASNAITILITQTSTNIASTVSSMLGLTGMLGDVATSEPFATVAQYVTQYGGQVLAYNTSGLSLTGTLNEALLPAQDANTLTGDQINSIVLGGAVTSVAIPGNNPIISFQVTNKTTGKGIRGLKAFAFGIAQLQPGVSGGPDEWLSYMVASATSRPSTESATSTANPPPPLGTLIDNGDGSYVFKMLKDVKTAATNFGAVYDANLTHRVAIQLRDAPFAGTTSTGAAISRFANVVNIFYDFVPASGGPVAGMLQREVVTIAACNECHTKLAFHGGSRIDTRFCVVCHTKQRANGRTASTSTNGAFTGSTYVADGEVVGNFVTMVHKIHMGNKLTKTGYNYANVLFNNHVYPQDVTNCRKCHKDGASAQGDNWQTRPSRQACGACHDGVDFTTHMGGQPNDANCNTCHAASNTTISAGAAHRTVNATPNNPDVPVGLTNFTYEIKSAAVNANGEAVITFRILGSTDGSAPAAITLPLTGFTGGPSFLLAYSMSTANQSFTTTADYNNLGVKAAQPLSVSIANLVDTTKGTLAAGTDADAGYYVATIATAYSFPAGSQLRAVGLQGYFTQAAGTNSIAAATARHAVSVQKAVTGDTVRRTVIDSAKCANCHEWFEGHGGNRVYQVQLCVMCHVPNLSSSGRGANPANTGTLLSATVQQQMIAEGIADPLNPTTYPEESNNFKDMIHGIHAGSSRADALNFVRDRGSVLMYFSAAEFVFPGILKDCTMCHTSSGYTGVPANAQVTTVETSDGTVLDLTNNVTAVAAARTSLPNAQDIVTTPFAAACVSCHDTVAAQGHMQLNGGQIRVARSAADPAKETCVVCHGTTGTANIANAHK